MQNNSKNRFTLLYLALISLVLTSCVPDMANSLRSRDTSSATNGNTTVGLYQGRVLLDNPIILSRNANLSDEFDLNKLLSTADITSNAYLKGSSACNFDGSVPYCFEVKESKDSPTPLQTTNGKWVYNANSAEFLQVNTFYHLNKIFNDFFTNLTNSYSLAYDTFGTQLYNTALPKSYMSSPGIFKSMDTSLVAFAKCDEPNNSYFDRNNYSLCFGYTSTNEKVKWAQDSTIIYHEAGHFFQHLQLNIRNQLIGPRSDMGNINYDEAGAIGEGLSDYYSYFINGRPHFAEWAAGRFLESSRPMSESDPLHAGIVSTASDQRLSYPQFIGYDPNHQTTAYEDIHTSGMIISHYMVALTQDLQDKCLMSKKEASNFIIHLLSETLAEHGDLKSNGTEGTLSENKINNISSRSADWFKTVNPITYRSFMQTFAKNLYYNLGKNLPRCNGGLYSKDQIESLIDQYGLLLFRTYNENRNNSDPNNPALTNTLVNATNRKKSVLISKNLLILDPTPNASASYVLDKREDIIKGLAELQASGVLESPTPSNPVEIPSNQTPSDLGFNNNNGRVSPGEVVAIAINLYNNSNTPMAGIQILANDWNHADPSGKPCRFPLSMSDDQWPLDSEGGVPCTTVTGQDNSSFAPVCFMQSNELNSTKWVSQDVFREKMGLDPSLCLNKNNNGKDCFIRTLKGADQAHFSKINPKSTWSKTYADATSGKAPDLNWGNLLLFEVSKHIPPGTIVDCRLRVRFTNCEDCYHKQSVNSNKTNYFSDPSHAIDGYDFTDTDYNGPRPFKIIHLQIPIID